MKYLSVPLLCDFYKISHRAMYPPKTELVYSTWTPRASRMAGVTEVVHFGLQAFIKDVLIDMFNHNFFWRKKEDVVSKYRRVIKHTLNESEPETKHIEDLHDLGYLPLQIDALPEGTAVPLRVPVMTIFNTDKRFFWLTNFVESLASSELWQPSTSATIAREYKKLLTAAALETVGDASFVPFQGHDFSMRGMSSLRSAVLSGLGHLTQFVGTDTIPAIQAAEVLYNANVEKELVGTSIPATEHSIQCTYGDDLVYFRNMISRVHPKGFVSIVADGYDFWNVIGNVLPTLKQDILARDGRVVIRPDSGDPVKIICGDPEGATELEKKGAIEALWDTFGGTTTAKGFKVLDSHIGLIYGDAITLSRAEQITEKLKAKGFASINAVFGIGSFTYQHNTRDTFGYALKSTACIIDGEEKMIFKDPKTDDGTKKSQKGRVVVTWNKTGLLYVDNLSLKCEEIGGSFFLAPFGGNLLQTVYRNGELKREVSFEEVRNNGKV